MDENRDGSDHDPAGDAAVEWFVRLRAGALSDEEQAAFEAWRENSGENAAAFEEVLHMYGHLAGMRASGRTLRPSRASGHSWFAGAAALVAASFALFVAFDDLSAYLRSDHYAGVGETKLVTLEDGSRVQLDAKSAISVRYGASERRLSLLAGEAWFQVAPDKARPFVVEAAGGTVTALGTAFDIALGKAGTRVTVTEHRVSVSSVGKSVVVEEGQQSSYARDAAAKAPAAVDAESATAWRRGKLIVEKQPLGEVLATLGRYRHGYVYCVTPATCARRVTGVFGTDDPLQTLHEIETSLELHALYLTNYMVLLYE